MALIASNYGRTVRRNDSFPRTPGNQWMLDAASVSHWTEDDSWEAGPIGAGENEQTLGASGTDDRRDVTT